MWGWDAVGDSAVKPERAARPRMDVIDLQKRPQSRYATTLLFKEGDNGLSNAKVIY